MPTPVATPQALGRYKFRRVVNLYDIGAWAPYSMGGSGAGYAPPTGACVITQTHVDDGSFTAQDHTAVAITNNNAAMGYMPLTIMPGPDPAAPPPIATGGPGSMEAPAGYEDAWLRNDIGLVPDYPADMGPLPAHATLRGARLIPHVRGGEWIPTSTFPGRYNFGVPELGGYNPPPDISVMNGVVCGHLIAYDPHNFATPPTILHTFTYDSAHQSAGSVASPANDPAYFDAFNGRGGWQVRSYTQWWQYAHDPTRLYERSFVVCGPELVGFATDVGVHLPGLDSYDGRGGDAYNGPGVFISAPNVSWGSAPGAWYYKYTSGPPNDDANYYGYITRDATFLSASHNIDPVTVTPYDIDLTLPYADVKGKWLAIVYKISHKAGNSYYGFDLAINDKSDYKDFGMSSFGGPLTMDVPPARAETQPPAFVMSDHAVLHGRIGIPGYPDSSAGGQPQFGVKVWMDFGATDAYELTTVPAQDSVALGWLNYSRYQTGLLPGHTYHYRIRCEYWVVKDNLKPAGSRGPVTVWPPASYSSAVGADFPYGVVFEDKRLGTPIGLDPGGPIGVRPPNGIRTSDYPYPIYDNLEKVVLIGRDVMFTTPTDTTISAGAGTPGVLPALHG